jgi:hypothetical protein
LQRLEFISLKDAFFSSGFTIVDDIAAIACMKPYKQKAKTSLLDGAVNLTSDLSTETMSTAVAVTDSGEAKREDNEIDLSW